MLQRVQTIFLSIIILAIGTLFFLPIWNKIDLNTLQGYTMYAWGIEEMNNRGTPDIWSMPYVWLTGIATLIVLISIYEISKFKNRMLQLKLGAINNLLLTALLGIIVYLVTKNQSNLLPQITGQYKIGFVMPIIGVVSNFLANYFIRKDERFIRSTNRIR